MRRIVYVSRIIVECTLYYYFVSIIGLYIELRSTGMKDLKTGA